MAINWSDYGSGFDWVIVSQFGETDTSAHDLVGHIEVYLPVDNGRLKTPNSIKEVGNWGAMQRWFDNYDDEEIEGVGFYFTGVPDGGVPAHHDEWNQDDEDYPDMPTISDFYEQYAAYAEKYWDKNWTCIISARTDEYEWAELSIQKVVA